MSSAKAETLTVRIPKFLKASVEQAARARATTVTSIVRNALQESIRPSGRLYEPPGCTKAFDEFLKNAREHKDRPVLLLVVEERSGHRYFFDGLLDHDLTNDSLVAIGHRQRERRWVLLRRDIVAWFGGNARDLNQLAMSLVEQGWAARSSMYQ